MARVHSDGFVMHRIRAALGLATAESGHDEYWWVDLVGSDDEWAGVFVEGGRGGMTAVQARAMAQALVEAADTLDAAS